MKRALILLVLLACPIMAQVPKAQPVDAQLSVNVMKDFFLRGENLYKAAQASTVQENRVDYFQRAAQIFSDYLTEFPNSPDAEIAWWYLGNSYYQSGRIDDGKRCFSTLLNRYGKGVWVGRAAYTFAADYYNSSEYSFAAPLFEKYAMNSPNLEEAARGYFYMGNCYRFLNRDREAITAYKKIISEASGITYLPLARLAVAQLTQKAGKLEDSLVLFEEIVAAPYAPKVRAEAALGVGITASKLGDADKADQALKLILAAEGMEEFRPNAQTILMGNLLEKKQYREILAIYRSSPLKATGENEAARLMIAGRACMALKLPAEALQIFREIEKTIKPESDLAFQAAFYRLYCFYEIEGRHLSDQVDGFLQIYQKSRPQDALIHTAMLFKAETLFAANKVGDAAKVYSQINATLLNDEIRAGLLYKRGWCLAEAGDSQGAIRSITDFVMKYSNDSRVPSALAKRAKAYVDIAEAEKAIADFDQLTVAGMPDDLMTFAWLESARLRRAGQKIPDMIVRYRGLLKNSKDLSNKLKGEANYWIGWGLIKSNTAKDAIPYLEAARTIQPADFSKHAGLALAICYFVAQDPVHLAEEIQLAIRGNYVDDMPDKYIQWSGLQSYNSRNYPAAVQSLTLVSNPDEPRETPKDVWRYLAKSCLEIAQPDKALTAVDHFLAVEENPMWKADGLLDRGRALYRLKRFPEARTAVDDALGLRPQGFTSAGLNLLDGDLLLESGDAKKAAGKYLIVVEFINDKELKPLAIHKLISAFEKQGDYAEAEKYSQQLNKEFPDWKASTL